MGLERDIDDVVDEDRAKLRGRIWAFQACVPDSSLH